jgi:hypothetical protein
MHGTIMHGTIMQRTAQPLSPASIAHLRKVAAEISAFFEAGGSVPERPSLDAAWAVLEAAVDFDDGPTVDAARRVIDAGLNGELIAESDLLIVNDYFK